ncbi:MAG: hypothetical protein SV765_05910 [Pseudomonadota bacterium]|nr:hypothetical protein [Pseudomonadota bacterium]
MQQWLASRVNLTPRPRPRPNVALAVAMLGHCPGPVRVERLLAMADTLTEMRQIGLGPVLQRLANGTASSGEQQLHHLPIPLQSRAEFHDIFPAAGTTDTEYVSLLAGRRAWLPRAVDDFFANGGEKLWLVAIPESEGLSGFLPAPNTLLHEPASLRGVATVAAIPEVGSLALPDLERLQVPARLADVPRVRLDNPSPRFLPCGTVIDDDHRERRNSGEMELSQMPDPAPFNQLLQGILPFLSEHRPDLQILLTLPLAYAAELDTPAPDPAALQTLRDIRDGDSGHRLRQMQFVFPYLRGADYALHSPVGIISGRQSARAQQQGPWRSVAGQPLQTDGLPYPAQSVAATVALRNDPGIGILRARQGRVTLDDERLVMPALHPQDYAHSNDLSRFDGFRAAEIMRLLGYLQRQLRALGEQLLFTVDYRDPRPRLLLERFFRHLQQQGALRGATAEEAFHIEEIRSREGQMIYEIRIAPAFPIDQLRLTFSNLNGQWQGRVNPGGISHG